MRLNYKSEMMGKKLYILFTAVLAISFTACSKENTERGNGLPYITFGVSDIDIETKGLISNSDFTSNDNPIVYVYGVKNNNNSRPIFNGVQIQKAQDNNNWTTTPQIQWEEGASYSFHGYTYSPQTPTHNALMTINNETGLKLAVSQPDTYSEESMIDYMLSHAYKVADGSNYRTVMLYMQHTMAWIEIEVWKEQENHDIQITDITLSNIYRSAVMQCDFQAIAGSGEKNVWTVQLSGRNDQVYSTGVFAKPADGVTKLGYMRVLAIPQQITNNTALSVSYTVNEPSGLKNYTQVFYLKDYVPYVWESGHKIKYTLNINTGVHLEASVAEWKEGGYTEGVILPPSKTN